MIGGEMRKYLWVKGNYSIFSDQMAKLWSGQN